MIRSAENYTAVLATRLAIGDSIIGADDSEYLIEEIVKNEHTLTLHCVSELEQAVKTEIAIQAVVNKITEPSLREGRFGMRRCDSCDELRSKARGWSYDDYVCKHCRAVLDSDYE